MSRAIPLLRLFENPPENTHRRCCKGWAETFANGVHLIGLRSFATMLWFSDKIFAVGRGISQIAPMLRLILPLLILVATHVSVHAQDVDPALAPAMQRYDAAIAELRATRKTQISQVEAEYTRQLDAVMKSVTDEKKLTQLRAEKQGVAAGLLAAPKSETFPEEAAAARKSFLAAAGKAAFDYAAAKKKLDDAYLKEMAGIAKAAKGKNSPIGAQIAEEKRRVTAEN